MPFGLSDAPAVFQSFMNETFKDMIINKFIVVNPLNKIHSVYMF